MQDATQINPLELIPQIPETLKDRVAAIKLLGSTSGLPKGLVSLMIGVYIVGGVPKYFDVGEDVSNLLPTIEKVKQYLAELEAGD